MATATTTIEFVIDSSIALKWVLEEEDSKFASRLKRRVIAAPEFIFTECANVLWTKVRAAHMTPDMAVEHFRAIRDVPFELAPDADLSTSAFHLSLFLNHATYDCLYVSLAQRLNVPLVTADRRLITVVRNHPEPPCAVRSLEEFA